MADEKPTTNPFAGPPGAVPQQPVELEFETPPQAFEYPERSEHPDPKLIELLQLAELKAGTPTDEHRAALTRLLTILHQQVDEFRGGRRKLIDPALIHFFKRILDERGLRALADADPVDAARFLYGPRDRGRRAGSAIADRDFQIALEVASKMMLEHATLLNATDEVAKSRKLSRERVETIYKIHRKAARATVALTQIEAGPPEQGGN
jgi:hypothetical protein